MRRKTRLTVWNTYGRSGAPLASLIASSGVDAIVFDIQDVGARFYTFIWTLYDMMVAAATVRDHFPFVILDRGLPFVPLTHTVSFEHPATTAARMAVRATVTVCSPQDAPAVALGVHLRFYGSWRLTRAPLRRATCCPCTGTTIISHSSQERRGRSMAGLTAAMATWMIRRCCSLRASMPRCMASAPLALAYLGTVLDG